MKKLIFILVILAAINIVYAHECNETQENTTILPEGYCDVSLTLETDKEQYKNGETIKIYNKLSNKSYDFSIEYWIEDNQSNIIKEKLTTTNTNVKQFTPKLGDNTTLVLKNNLASIDCININNNTYNELLVFVEVEKDPEYNLTIQKIFLNRSKKIEIGNNLTAQIAAYSGNISNYSIDYYINNVTDSFSYLISNQFNYSIFNITLEIPNDCSINAGNYSLIAKHNELESIQNFTIINNCQITQNITNSTENYTVEYYNQTKDSNLSENVINLQTGPITGKVIYESASERTKKIATYLVMVVLAAVLIAIVTSSKDTGKILEKTTEKWSSQLGQRSKSWDIHKNT